VKEAMHKLIEIGIPIYKGLPFVESAIDQAIGLPNVGRIHVSVNEAGAEAESIRRLADRDSRIFITIQATNLGLYGNFRFLVRNAEYPLFSWLAYDDLHSKESYELASEEYDPAVGLYLPVYDYHEFDMDSKSWSRFMFAGRLPNSKKSDVFGPDPSWIFGIWNTNFLNSIFPKKDFDWLDTLILSVTMMTSKIHILANDEKLKIGITTGKSPHTVNGKWHGWIGWFARSIGLILRGGFQGLLVYDSLIRSSWGRFAYTWFTFKRYVLVQAKMLLRQRTYSEKVPQSK
jgi:hypothetical protein